MNRDFHSKVLLFGEYTVLLGGTALALPSPAFCGRWEEGTEVDQRLLDFLHFLDTDETLSRLLQTDRMKSEIAESLRFESQIPVGYGLGSSGALTAAVYDRYALEPSSDIYELHKILGQMECYFHGRSSGIDPLVSYLDVAVLKSGEELGKVEAMSDTVLEKCYLLDSGRGRSTSEWVERFKQKLEEDQTFLDAVEEKWLPLARQGIEATIAGKEEVIGRVIFSIQKLIWEHMNAFIPETHRLLWEQTLENESLSFKLCGAGGGGMSILYGDVPTDWGARSII